MHAIGGLREQILKKSIRDPLVNFFQGKISSCLAGRTGIVYIW
jgi:hypothetical protein